MTECSVVRTVAGRRSLDRLLVAGLPARCHGDTDDVTSALVLPRLHDDDVGTSTAQQRRRGTHRHQSAAVERHQHVDAARRYVYHSVVGTTEKICSVLDPRVGHTMDVLSPHLSLSFVVLADSFTGSPVHVLMLSIQAVRGLPRLRAHGILPCIISFSGQLPYEAMNGGAECRKWGGLGLLGDTQGHGQCRHSIERIRLPIRL